ncbi:MAG: S9 family peptidase [Acidobacteriaceae bacterium]|nr:S9 family peptidase [Acidobacteriaceae bacterium]
MRNAVCFLALFFCPVALPAAQNAAGKPVTIDAMLSAHHAWPITPEWAPDGKSFAYQKQSSMYIYDVASGKSKEWFQPQKLEQAAQRPVLPKEFGWTNRRVSSDSYQWFPNSKDMLVSANGDLFVVHPNGGFDQITKDDIDEEEPKLSPDGKQILYRWKSNLYVIDLATRQTRQLTNDGTPTLLNGKLDWVYPEELDLGTATWWSPDSRHIAYFQFNVKDEFVYPQTDLIGERALSEPERYPQAGTPNAEVKLGVISPEGGETKWMDLGSTADALLARVAWLPDSSEIALERFNRVQSKLDLLLCDLANGSVHPILHESSKTWVNVADNLFFLKSRPEFLWTSERSGFRQIYRYSNKGELLGQLTSGNWLVTAVSAIDEAKQRVYYMSTEASPLETQLYTVSFNGGERTRVTKEEGSHTVHANEDGSYFVDTYSSLKRPAETLLKAGDGRQLAVLEPADTKDAGEYDILPSEIVQVKAPDGTILYGRLIKPAGFQPDKKYPAIVSVYGGPHARVVQNAWDGLSWDQVLAHRGYVVWMLDNRGSTDRGLAFESPIYHEMGKVEVADQRLGVEHLIGMGFVDPNRIGITGWSYGGYMTIHSMLLAPDVFKVGVAGAPVTDWHNYDTIYTERYMGLPQDNARGYDASSNVKNAGKLEGKLLIVHNIEDDNVLFQNTMQMANALEQAGRPFFMQIYPQKTHGVSGPLRKSLYEEMANFFDAHLKGGSAPSEDQR